jgi:hypothetical protein
MIQLRDSGNVNAWNMYRDWVSRNGAMLALQPAQSITSIMGDTNSRIRFVFDAASNTVRAELSEPSAVRPGSLGAFSSAVLARHAVAESLAQDLTSVLQAMGPLARAESTGDDTTDQEILAILQAHNLEATPDPDNAGRMILRPRTGSRLGAGDVQPSEPASRGGVTVSDREPSPETEAEAARDEAAGASNLLNAWNEYERLNQEVRGAIETYERSPSSENLQKEIEAFERFRTFSRENRDMLEQRPVNQRNGWMDWLFGGGLRAGAEDAGVSPPEGVPSGWTVWHERRLRAIQSGEMNLDSVTNERNRTLIQGEIDRREREGVTPPPDTPGLSPDLERALERERTMTPEARRERDEAAAAADEVERNIYRESVEEARRSTDYWRRLAQEAQERGDTASASRFTERALQVEERLMSSEDRIITPRTPTQDQQQTREGPARTPAPTAVPVTRTINVDGVSNPMEAINQHNDAEVGAVLRVTVQGQEEPMFIQKTPAGWLIIPDPSKRGE